MCLSTTVAQFAVGLRALILTFMPTVKPKCSECDNEADAPKEQQSASYPLCASCLSKNWITEPIEIAQAIANDPELSKEVNIISPIQDL